VPGSKISGQTFIYRFYYIEPTRLIIDLNEKAVYYNNIAILC